MCVTRMLSSNRTLPAESKRASHAISMNPARMGAEGRARRLMERFATAGARFCGGRPMGGTKGPNVQRKLDQSIGLFGDPLSTAPPTISASGLRSCASRIFWHQSGAGTQWSSVHTTISPVASPVAFARRSNTEAPGNARWRILEKDCGRGWGRHSPVESPINNSAPSASHCGNRLSKQGSKNGQTWVVATTMESRICSGTIR